MKIGVLLETPNIIDHPSDIGFKTKFSLRQDLTDKTYGYVDYNPSNSIWSTGISYTPDNTSYVTAGISTDKNSIFNISAKFTF